jgi:glycosyltransferase involved in cell wall biosynthesis
MGSDANQKLLVIGTVFPEPNSSAAGARMLQIIDVFKLQNYQITFASTASDSDFMVNLPELGIEKVAIKLNHPSFDEFIKTLNPDVVLFDRFITEEQFGWRVSENCPNSLKILDTEDLHCLRAARQNAYQANQEFNTDLLLKEPITKREIASILRCDLSLIISSYEMKILKELFKIDISLLMYLPFMLTKITKKEQNGWKKFEDRKDFISIGNFLHEPNYQAVLYLKKHIWPLIHAALPQAKMRIYGAYPSQKVTQLHQEKQNFYVMGRAQSVNEVMENAKVCLAPLPFGAGLKGKVIDAMQNGTPCVLTAIAVEGMFGDLKANGFIANEPADFAKKAVEIYSSIELFEQFQANGVNAVNQLYNKSKWQKLFLARINNLIENLDQHRLNNFMGAMLQHHTLNSTKYLAKWIEEKNSK